MILILLSEAHPALRTKIHRKIKKLKLNVISKVGNPFDMPANNSDAYLKVGKVIDRCGITDIILFIFADPISGIDAEFCNKLSGINASVAVCFTGGGAIEMSSTLLMGKAGIAVFPSPERAIKGINGAVQRAMFSKLHF